MATNNRNKIRQRYTEKFTRHLTSLNTAQMAAVESIDGPMMVIAGPGTGKTHILTARIGRILRDTDTQPGNILCLTFTDAGVYAMRERLLELIGPEAHRVHIYTFHSFCNNVIQENMEYFGRHELEPLSELERVELLRKLIDQRPSDHLLRQRSNDVYYYERHLFDLFKQMKSENWSPEFILERIETYINSLPDQPDFRYKRKTKEFEVGDLKQWKYDEAISKMAFLKVAATLYPKYVNMMKRARRYDFDDMILWVLEAFQKNEALLKTYQERYLYFLVDEYQDTNGAQNQVLQEMIQYWDNPNVFIVGDDDQSIFEFQGARLKNLVDFYHQYKDNLNLVILTENYRSSQHILNSSRTVIECNDNRIIRNLDNVSKILTARHPQFSDIKVLPEIVAYENRAQEEADLVSQIEKLYKDGFPMEEVAIIYARHQQARNIITLLEKKQIPYNTRKQINILDLPLILNVRLFLEYLNAEYQVPYSGEFLLYKILSLEFLGIPPIDLAKMSFHLAPHHSDLNWRTLIGDEIKLREIGVEAVGPVIQFSQLLNELISQYRSYPLLTLIEKIINRSGLLASLLKKEDKEWHLQVISTFFSFVQKETDRNPRLTLNELLEIFNKLDANRLSVRIQKTIFHKNGVNLVTAHSSKGLEFQRVYLIDGVQDQWEPSRQSASRRFKMPDTVTLSGEADATEARRRLFYVAMTRAKAFLHISYAEKTNVGKTLQRTQFIDEILSDGSVEIVHKSPPTEAMFDAQLLLLLTTEKPKIVEQNKEAVAGLLEGFTLSVTSLNSFLRCPLGFYHEHVLRIPAVQSEAASYGIAMHYALSKIFEIRQLDPQKPLPSAEETIVFFKAEMQRQRGYFTPAEFKRRMDMGINHLQLYYDQFSAEWPDKILVEYYIKNTEIAGVPIKGTIDRIDFFPKSQSVSIIDYKTGRPNSSRFSKLTEKNPHGGLYRRQLIFYKLLYEAAQNEFFARHGSIAYFEPDYQGKFTIKSVEFTSQEVQVVKDLIKGSYEKIMVQEFYEGCGEDNCKWCNFVKNNIAVDSFTDLEAEAMDD